MSASELEPLSPRQRQIAEMLADFHERKAIAATLGISLSTVERYIARIVVKLNLDPTKKQDAMIGWLAVNARYDTIPNYEHVIPRRRSEAA